MFIPLHCWFIIQKQIMKMLDLDWEGILRDNLVLPPHFTDEETKLVVTYQDRIGIKQQCQDGNTGLFVSKFSSFLSTTLLMVKNYSDSATFFPPLISDFCINQVTPLLMDHDAINVGNPVLQYRLQPLTASQRCVSFLFLSINLPQRIFPVHQRLFSHSINISWISVQHLDCPSVISYSHYMTSPPPFSIIHVVIILIIADIYMAL